MRIYEGIDLGAMLTRSCSSVPDKVAIIDGGRRITYQELQELVTALAFSLLSMGLRKGDRVAIYMPNSVELISIFYALQKIGVIVAWVNPNYRKAEAGFIIKNSGAKAVAIFREWEGYDYLKAVEEIRDSTPALEKVILVGEGEAENIYLFDDLIKKGHGLSSPEVEIIPDQDLAMLIYTSGTTGKPKGAMITHYQSIRAGYQYSLGVNAGANDIFLGVLPMSHSYGCGALLIQPFLLQATLVLMDKFSPEEALSLIEMERVTVKPAAPAHYILLLNNPSLAKYDISSLRAGMIAGQVAPEGLITQVEKEMGVYLTSFWGASEVGPGLGIICPYPSPLEIREAYIGKPIKDTRVKVVDPETREELGPGEIGELVLSGWHVMKGYWQNPEETSRQIIDGWLHMGDLVSREKNGYFRIYGRIKDLINRGGYKIYPVELESLLGEHPCIQEVCVVATPNPVLGESTCACVVPKPGKTLNLKSIRDFLKDKVASHKLPDELCIMDSFPKLSGGVKLNKFGKGGIAEYARNDKAREKYRN